VPTVDGKYTGTEWSETGTTTFGTNGHFSIGWVLTPTTACFIIETSDATNDPGDYWAITFDSTADGGATEPNGGTAPQVDDFKLVVTGHTSPTVQWYKGTGTVWAAVTPTGWTDPAIFSQNQSLSASPTSSTPHYILEITIDKTNTAGFGIAIMGYNWASYIAYNDAHTGGNGLQAWPPTPATDTNPNSWGYVPYQFAAIPETLNIGLIVALSSVAVVAGSIILNKRSLTKLAKKYSL
jgi:hypothetical protein